MIVKIVRNDILFFLFILFIYIYTIQTQLLYFKIVCFVWNRVSFDYRYSERERDPVTWSSGKIVGRLAHMEFSHIFY